MAEMIELGSDQTMRFTLSWTGPEEGDASEVTRGLLTLYLRGRPVWGTHLEPFEWTWIELLEYLAESWMYLKWEQVTPAPGGVFYDDLQAYLRSFKGTPAEEAEVYDRILEFRQYHDLSRALGGAWATPVLVVRQGRRIAVSTPTDGIVAEDILETLRDLGNALAERARLSRDARAQAAISTWNAADASPTVEFMLKVAAGLDDEEAQVVRPFAVQGNLVPESEFLVAARMSSGLLPGDAMKTLMLKIKGATPGESAPLEALTSRVLEREVAGEDWQQGYELAHQTRDALGLSAEQVVSPRHVLRRLGVPVTNVDLESEVVDAVCIFGPSHGPAVFVNLSGRHAQSRDGRKTTLAHELCHLVADRGSALPFAEVMGSRAPRHLERRARAFAAEFLLLRSVARKAADDASPTDLRSWRDLVSSLSHRFEVSNAVAALQLKNGHEPGQMPRPVVEQLRYLGRDRALARHRQRPRGRHRGQNPGTAGNERRS